jgi:hypothetical protein
MQSRRAQRATETRRMLAATVAGRTTEATTHRQRLTALFMPATAWDKRTRAGRQAGKQAGKQAEPPSQHRVPCRRQPTRHHMPRTPPPSTPSESDCFCCKCICSCFDRVGCRRVGRQGSNNSRMRGGQCVHSMQMRATSSGRVVRLARRRAASASSCSCRPCCTCASRLNTPACSAAAGCARAAAGEV